MDRIHIILIWIALACTCSCSTTYHSFSKRQEGGKYALVEPVSNTWLAKSDGSFILDRALCEATSGIISECILSSETLPITAIVSTDDGLQEDIDNLFQAIQTMESGLIPERICSSILENGCRYGILVYSVGFTRDKKGLLQSVLGEMTDGMAAVASGAADEVSGEVHMHSSHIALLIVDVEEKTPIYYGVSTPQEKNPVSVRQIERQVNSLLRHYK